MHGAKRSATVTCKNSVELLAVGREDFVDIFMPMDKDQEPEHIRFLRTVHLMKGWPIERLPYHDPKICCFTYFRYGLQSERKILQVLNTFFKNQTIIFFPDK